MSCGSNAKQLPDAEELIINEYISLLNVNYNGKPDKLFVTGLIAFMASHGWIYCGSDYEPEKHLTRIRFSQT